MWNTSAYICVKWFKHYCTHLGGASSIACVCVTNILSSVIFAVTLLYLQCIKLTIGIIPILQLVSIFQRRRARKCGITKVNQTGGNRSGLTGYRSNRSGSGSGSGRYSTGQNSNFKFEFKKWKIPKKFRKILQGVMNLMVSNFLKNSFI